MRQGSDELLLAYGPSGSGKTHTLGVSGILGLSVAYLLGRMTHAKTHGIKPIRWNEMIINKEDSGKAVDDSDPVDQEVFYVFLSFIEVSSEYFKLVITEYI